MKRFTIGIIAIYIAVSLMSGAGYAQSKSSPMKVIFDTDIGDDIDDAYAMALLFSMPDVKVLGVSTAFGETGKRAQVAAKLLHVMGRDDIKVYVGRAGDAKIARQYDWAKQYSSKAIQTLPALEFMRSEIEKNPGQITLIAVGPLTNVGDLAVKYPATFRKLARIVIMGGAVYSGYGKGSPVTPEWNIKCDPTAAKAVFEGGVDLTMAGLEVTYMLQLDIERQKKLIAHGNATTNALGALTTLWGNGVPTLFDPMAVAWACGGKFCDFEKKRIVVEKDGMTRITEGIPNVTVLINAKKDAFLNWYVEKVFPNTDTSKKK